MGILYKPEDKPPLSKTLIYSLQWIAFNLVNVAVVPVVVGSAVGLSQVEIGQLAQRTMVFASFASILQVIFGHRLPIIEGPAGMWYGIFITLGAMAPNMGKDLALLRTDLQLGVIAAGIVLIIFGMMGIMGKVLKFFTPAVTGTVLVLLTLQLSGSFVKGMLGIESGLDKINIPSLVVSATVIIIIVAINLKGKGFLNTMGILIGTLAGWLLAIIFGIAPAYNQVVTVPFFQLPVLLAWGSPTLDIGIIFVSILIGLLVLSNLVASILAMERTLEIKTPPGTYDKGVIFTGIADVLAGLGSTVGVVPYSASAGLVSLTGVGSKAPFILYAVTMMVLGLFPPVGSLLTLIPKPVGYAVLAVSFCQMLIFGLKDYHLMKLDRRGSFVIGLPIIIGTGIISLPPGVFQGFPAFLQYIIGNGFVTGMLLCILLEHFFIPKTNP
ncbi:MAG: purine/pyrimidine permease [Bacillota bacterium]